VHGAPAGPEGAIGDGGRAAMSPAEEEQIRTEFSRLVHEHGVGWVCLSSGMHVTSVLRLSSTHRVHAGTLLRARQWLDQVKEEAK
jgi:hypothetical protein